MRRGRGCMAVTDAQLSFVVGSERSGTTLIAVLLDRHSSIAVPPETHFLAWVRDQHRWANRCDATAIDPESLLAYERLRDLGTAPAALAHAMLEGRTPTYASLWRWLLADYAARHGKAIVIEKTPDHLQEVPRLLRWFPQGHVICVVRDGRDVCVSLRRVPWTHDDLQAHALRWRSDQRLARRWARRYPDRVTVVRYEDLCRDPAAVLRLVLDRLRLTFEPGQLDPTRDSPTVPAWEREWKQGVTGAISAARVGTWRTDTTEQERRMLERTMARELERWGYAAVRRDERRWGDEVRLRLAWGWTGLRMRWSRRRRPRAAPRGRKADRPS